jgi:hypothetical protein
VNVDDPAIVRAPASSRTADSDLGDIAVTVDVPPLAHEQVQAALRAGLKRARALQSRGLIWSAALICQGRCARAEPAATSLPRPTLAEAA